MISDIIVSNSHVTRPISSLQAGHTFIMCDRLYIITDEYDAQTSSKCAVCMRRGERIWFNEAEIVRPVSIELSVEILVENVRTK